MGPIIRIALRYIAGALVTYGLVPADIAAELAADPDVFAVVSDGVNWAVVAAGAGLAGAIEWAYKLAKKYGWST